ncbi:MAG: hypothetical protein KF757_11020 [Phycisphaeraceae bacterium]|nr:hypothetical protein [Phycisphaeraceae bacterium]MCW5762221.1 hypothetical protein [Phycisphaeraceae bacterium]
MNLLRIILSILVATALMGCRTPPKVGPFAEASSSLNLVIDQTGKAFAAELALIGSDSEQTSADFESLWAPRVRVASAIADYAHRLVEVVSAAENSASQAREVFESGQKLLASVNTFPGGDAALKLTADAFTIVYERYANQRAAVTVDRAVHDADPMIRDIAKVFSADLQRLRKTLPAMRSNAITNLTTPYAAEGTRPLAALNDLRDERQAIAEYVLGLSLDEQLSDQNFEKLKVLALREQMLRSFIETEQNSEWHQKLQRERTELNARFDQMDATLVRAAALTEAWAASHSNLVDAVRSGRSPDYRLLVHMTEQLLSAYTEYEKARP